MVDLLDKHKGIIERRDRMLQLGVNAMGPVNDKILSPTRAIINGKETILAGTNNYMGMTFDQSCIDAGKSALDEFGTGTTGSRVANGNYAMHKSLEKELAAFLNKKHCIVFTTGYQANLGMMSGLAGPRDTIFLDSDSHSSIYDGCTLSGAKLVRFRHNDATDLDKRMARSEDNEGGKLVVLQLLVDEAHSFGVLGPNGRGLADEIGVEDEADFVVGTFSKSVGSIGGFGAGDHPLFEVLRYAMRPYLFTASSSPATIATSLQAVKVLAKEPERRDRIRANSERLFAGFKNLGFDMGCDVVSPVIAVKCKDEISTIKMWNAILQAGVYVNIALPPGTPNRLCLLRCSVSAAHTLDDIDKIIDIFGKVVKG
jgi:8-amino-7-oxononanoate synthase